MTHPEFIQELMQTKHQLADAQRTTLEAVGKLEEAKEEISSTRMTLHKWQPTSLVLKSTFLLSIHW